MVGPVQLLWGFCFDGLKDAASYPALGTLSDHPRGQLLRPVATDTLAFGCSGV